MFIVEILDNGEWKIASQHTLEEDALRQSDMFIESGLTAPENLRVVELGDNDPRPPFYAGKEGGQ